MQMNRLKFFVGGMSALIIIAIGLVIYGMVSNLRLISNSAEPIPITLEKNSKIMHMTGIDDNLVLHVRSKRKEEILIVDPRDSSIRIRIPIKRKTKRAK